jgi:ketosteroid isomerase-like protein
MKKTLVFAIVFALALSACAGVKADVPDNEAAKVKQAIVEEWMAAYQAYDAEALLSLYSDDMSWMDYGYNDDPYHKVVLKGAVHEWFASEALKVEVKSYLVTMDGRFAVVNAIYSEKNGLTGKWNSTQAVAILEFNDGKIVKETWYYNTSVFHQY